MRNGSSSSPILTTVTISGNSAENGGGMYNESSSPTLTTVTISGNIAYSGGGGMYNGSSSSPTLTNVTISGNSADRGGGMCNGSSSPAVRNSVVWGNRAGDTGPGVYNTGSTPTFSYSIVQDSGGSGSWVSGTGTDGGDNLSMEPLFVDWINPSVTGWTPTSEGNYRLKNGSGGDEGDTKSPAIDAGDPGYSPDGAAVLDLDGTARVKGGRIDMGAYERE
jgi:hypothetical protein